MTASVFPPAAARPAGSSAPTRSRSGERRPSVVPASAADHPGVYNFLTAVFQGPSRGEFRASLEDPHYQPIDRLLVKDGPRILAHAHVVRRGIRFGPLDLPVAGLGWLGTLPALRGQGYGRQLLSAAEDHMASTGALLGLVWTSVPHFFRRTGWALCGRRWYGRAGARDVVSGLMARGLLRRARKRLNIRPWRRVELGALVRIYNENLRGAYGPVERGEAYWKWLVHRNAFDQICVALDGPDLLELEENHAPIVGYMVTRGERIVEMFTALGHPNVAAQLLARACQDAMEHGRHTVRLDAPPNSRIGKLFRAAAGKHGHYELDLNQVLMAKLLAPVMLLRNLAGELQRRADEADLPRPVDLGLLVDGNKYRLAIGRGGVEAIGRTIGRSYLRMNVADFTRLVLGHLDWEEAVVDGRVQPSTNLALKAGRALFPKLPLWFPPFDNLAGKE